MLGQPRGMQVLWGENKVWKVKGRFAGTGLCGHKNLELNIIGVRLGLVMKQVI